MEYLKAFIIGTSILVTFHLLTNHSNYYKYNYDVKYSFIIPIYYGLMCILSIYLKKRFKLSYQLSLLITSILSCIVILRVNHVLIDKYYIKNKSKKHKTTFYIHQDIIRELITFNLIVYTLSTLFDKYNFVKLFVIGSSIFIYYLGYYSISKGAILAAGSRGKKNVINFDYKDFTISEPFSLGIGLVIGVYMGVNILKLNLFVSVILYYIIAAVCMALYAYNSTPKMYILSDKDWIHAYLFGMTKKNIILGIISIILINIFKDKNKLFN